MNKVDLTKIVKMNKKNSSIVASSCNCSWIRNIHYLPEEEKPYSKKLKKTS